MEVAFLCMEQLFFSYKIGILIAQIVVLRERYFLGQVYKRKIFGLLFFNYCCYNALLKLN